ncbi:MAG: hypothetical protein Q4F52_08575, partial [Bacteroidaceae bacterium]|nr:hypothetical protein [Bacteroidaceae bacterium]
AHSHLFIKFASILRHSGGLGGRTFKQKVLLKLSSLMKFSQNFSAVKVIAVAPHHLIYTYLYRSAYYQYGVGYCFIQQQRQCEKPHQ